MVPRGGVQFNPISPGFALYSGFIADSHTNKYTNTPCLWSRLHSRTSGCARE